ncbi:alpha/beta hydrolase [Microlunatus capsulatus]
MPTPKLSWSRCVTGAECATVKVPLDYDKPKGAKVELALLRVKARDRKNRIGTLFVNPGGPGGSSVDLALASPDVLSAKVRDRFDVVGVDPRGIGYGTPVSCFSSTRAQNAATAGYTTGFPLGAKQEKAWVAADKKLGKACSGDTMARSMSTAQVARDMELMRRAVGDKKLSYLGFSYGTYLGQVYANMFPSKVRAVAVDGVIDPVAWAGSKANAAQPLEWRLNSSGGAWKALREVLVRCDKAGTSRCSFAAGDPVAKTATIAARLKARPLVVEDQDGDEVTVTYAYLVSALLGELYDPAGYESVTDLLSYVDALTTPVRSTTARSRTSGAERARTSAALVGALRDAEADRPRWGYDNSLDAFTAVTCTDSRETTKGSQYAGWATKADRRAPYFGRAWLWGSSTCAADAFTGNDEDAYTGPFTARTAAPLLFVGNDYDPATNYAGAVSAAKRMPGARLLRSRSFGHTAYGTSRCATGAVDAYLLKGTLPKAGTVCVGDVQPFASSAAALRTNSARQVALQEQSSALLSRR